MSLVATIYELYCFSHMNKYNISIIHEEKDVEELHMERFRQRYGIALTKKKLQEIILMLMAWEAVFAFSYLGYIELPAISTTTLHILVIVAAMMLGAQGSVPVVCVLDISNAADMIINYINAKKSK